MGYMKNLLVLMGFFCSVSFAATIQTSIHEVDVGTKQNDEVLVFSNTDGKVYRILNQQAEQKLVSTLLLAKETKIEQN